MFLQSFWDMTRDARFNLFDYVDLALEIASTENSDRVVLQLSSAMEDAARYLWRLPPGADPDRIRSLKNIEDFVAERIRLADRGSDRQTLWIDAYLNIAHSPEAAERIGAWLQPGDAVSVHLDQDRRWNAVVTLNALGAADGEELWRRELASDPSDNGRRKSLAAEAAWPEEGRRR